jgi:exopolysaccharide biosynthesis polyprenyl glycosylphosphotransferase
MMIRLNGTRIYEPADYFEEHYSVLPVSYLKDSWFLGSTGFLLLQHTVALKLKRTLDVVLAILMILILSPLMALIGIAIMLDSKGPIIFVQTRIGQGGKTFNLYKFRSMVADAEADGAKWAQIDDPRTTKLGKLLRKSRLDELPQVWNVLRGDMSFIGPRPERPEFVQKLESKIPYYGLRSLVKPGISGWAQVMYPYGSSVEDARRKLGYDLFYIKNYSIYLDLLILIRTIKIVIYGQGR